MGPSAECRGLRAQADDQDYGVAPRRMSEKAMRCQAVTRQPFLAG